MRKDLFYQRHAGLSPDQIDRKWRALMEEQFLYEAALARQLATAAQASAGAHHGNEPYAAEYLPLVMNSPTAVPGSSFGDGTIYFFSGAFGPASVSYSIPTWSDCDDNYAFGKVGSPFTVSDVEAMLAYVADNDSPPPFYYGHIDSPLGSYELVSFPPDLEGQLCYLAVLQPQQLILLHFSFIYLFRNF